MRFYKNLVQVGGRKLTVVTVNQEDGEVVTEVKKVTTSPKVHHIQILDRSGSMAGHIHQLISQVQKTLDLMGGQDLVSIVWFSSPGQYRTLVKGAKKSPELVKMLDSLRSTLGTTCFSDPMKEVKQIVEELSPLCPDISITLFTDGQAVTSWSPEEEENRTLDLVKSFKDKVISVNTVGYSNFYRQDFLKSLSSLSEFGVFTHSSNIEDYYQIFRNNFERIVEGKIENVHIEYPLDIDGIYLNRKFTKMEKLEMWMSRLDKNKNQFFLVGKGDFTFIYNDKEIFSKDLKEEVADPTVKNFLYSYAYGLYYTNKRRESLEVLACLRDKALLDSHMSAFTFDECAMHQALLEKAVLNTGNRIIEGVAKANYLPPKDAFCVMDLMQMLAKSKAFYLPFHKEAEEYERIGKKTTDTHDMFVWGSDPVLAEFSDMVWNKDKVNLSVRICVPGTVKLNPKEAREVGLPETVDSQIFRNHTFIKDGSLNIKKVIVLMPETLYNEIQGKRKILEMLDNDKALMKKVSSDYGKPYVMVRIMLSRIPIINASYNEDVSAAKVFNTCSKLLNLECYQKYLGYYWKGFETSATASQMKVGVFENRSADQIRVLENHGIEKSGSYSGIGNQTPKNADCDFYETRTFKFAFKGISDLPSVKEVQEKVAAKKTTISVSKMNEAHLRLIKKARESNINLGAAVVQTRDWLTQEIMDTKSQIFGIRAELCALKMAKLLNGDNFEGFVLDKKQNLCFEKGEETLYLKMDRTKEYF